MMMMMMMMIIIITTNTVNLASNDWMMVSSELNIMCGKKWPSITLCGTALEFDPFGNRGRSKGSGLCGYLPASYSRNLGSVPVMHVGIGQTLVRFDVKYTSVFPSVSSRQCSVLIQSFIIKLCDVSIVK